MPAPSPSSFLSVPLTTRSRRALVIMNAVVGVNAVGGMAYALGGAKAVPTEWLQGTPFNRYVIPGVYLGAVVGGSCLAAAVLAERDHPGARAAALGASGVMVTSIGA